MEEKDRIPDGFKLPDRKPVNEGGDFRITAAQFLEVGENSISDISKIQGDSYTNEQTGARLYKNEDGNWVYSISMEVPATDDDQFYTVFEQHQEVPGYAKINDSSAEWTIMKTGGETTKGTGKFLDEPSKNIYESMSEIHHGSNVYNAITYNEKEDVCIAAGAFKRIKINEATTITFTNHYKGDLDLTKAIGEDNQDSGAADKGYKITIQPADLDKLTLGSTGSHGLNGKTFSYTIKKANGYLVDGEKTAVLNKDGAFEITLKPGEIAHFTDMPAIQWQATENAESNAVEGYSLDITYSDENKGVLKDATHWNEYETNDIIGGTRNNDGIASVDNAVRDNPEDPKVDADAVALIKVTNTYKSITGDLILTKEVVGTEVKNKEYSFTISGRDKEGENGS